MNKKDFTAAIDVAGRHRSDSGFSLMELLVAMGIMSVVLGAAFVLLGRSVKFADTTYSMTEAEQSMRAAHEVVNRDLTIAGDGLRGMNMIKVPIFFVQNYLTKNPVVDPSTPNYPNLGLVTSDDNVSAGTGVPQTNPATTVLAGSDRMTVMAQDTNFPSVSLLAGKITYNGATTSIVVPDGSQFQAGEIYAIASQNSIAFGVISGVAANTLTLNNGDVYGINETGASAPIFIVTQMNTTTKASSVAASIFRLQLIHYFVNAQKLLIRRIFGVRGAGHIDSVVAEHITSFQIRYFLNTADANGFVGQPVSQLSLTNQAGVREVEANISVETIRSVNNTNSGNGGRATISARTNTTVRNLQFREAL